MMYQITVINCGVEHVLVETSSKKKAMKEYTKLVRSGGLVRVRINGNMLKILDADKRFLIAQGVKPTYN